MKHEQQIAVVKKSLTSIGFTFLCAGKTRSENGVDLWVTNKESRPISVEIKLARDKENGTTQVDPVSLKRQQDDLMAIIISPDYVLIEPMRDHLSACSKTGVRSITVMRP